MKLQRNAIHGLMLAGAGALMAGCVTTDVNYGTITTFAGSPGAGYAGDGGAATSAKLGSPVAVAADSAGNIYIADATANVVRRVSAAGTISTVVGTGVAGYSGDGAAATAAQLSAPEGLAVDASNNLYIADSGNNVIRRVLSGTGIISTVAGNGAASGTTTGTFSGDGLLAVLAGLNHPFGVALDASGNLYISDTVNNRVRRVSASTGIINTIAGNGGSGLSGDGGAATSATLYNPEGLVVASDGTVFVAEEANSVVRRIAASGTISTYAGGVHYGFEGDGHSAVNAELDGPTAVSLDASGILYVCDGSNSLIRRVTTNDTIQSVAGDGTQGYSGDGHEAIDAALNRPRGVVIAPGGAMYIADSGNNVVRKVTP